MYIRRKVFSIGYDENGEERLFSTNEILNEGAYLRMFAEKEEEKKEEKKGLTKAQKRALLAAGGVATTAAGIYGAKKIGAKRQQLGEAINLLNRDVKQMTSKELARLEEIQNNPKLMEKALKVAGKMKDVSKGAGRMLRQGKSLQKPADLIVKGSKKGYNAVADVVKKGFEKTKKLGKNK